MLAEGKFHCNSIGKLVENGLSSLGQETNFYVFRKIFSLKKLSVYKPLFKHDFEILNTNLTYEEGWDDIQLKKS